MSQRTAQPKSRPVFRRCAKCDYSLRGLPANHACPECELRFDEQCELFRVKNPKKVRLVWAAILGSGWIALETLPLIANSSAASTWGKIGVTAAVAWILFSVLGIVFLFRHYRRGYQVAVTSDGLIVRLPGISDKLVPWQNIGGASVEDKPEGKPQIASVRFKDRWQKVAIGGLCNVFPTRAHVERFVEQVNARAQAAKGENAQHTDTDGTT